jgi:alkanesulfonate monooxygenase SsuD/methylene tetrahydromethanopterin reductase-like flavin-dependent oxidoreductase (luciferase family)
VKIDVMLSKQGRWADMTNSITDDLMHAVAVFGTPDEVAADITRRYADCDRVCACFSGYKPGDDLIADLATALHG